jgi:hypothetical protein
MSSQNELLQALVNELPYVQSLVSEIKDLKKEVKRETKQTKKWKKKHDALLNILHDYPSLMGTVKNEVVDLTSVEEEDVSSIRISYDPVQIKTENIVEDDEMSIEDGEIIETPQQKKEALELTAVNPVSDEEMEVVEEVEEVEEVEVEDEEEEVDEEEMEVEEEDEEEEEMEVEEEDEEEEELFELEINGKTYFVTDENNGVIYEALEDDDVGEMLGNLKNGKPIWNKTQNTKK